MNRHNLPAPRSQQGVGMMEILIAMIVVAVGILGLGALQLQATRASGNSAYYSQAVWVVNDIVNRMQALRPEDHDDYTKLIQAFNTANTTVFKDMACNKPTTDCAAAGGCADRVAQITWDFWDAGCPSRKRAAGAAVDLTKTVEKPLDWFNQPQVTVNCTVKPSSFYLPATPATPAPPATPTPPSAPPVPDCVVELSWSTRSDIPEATSANNQKNASYYSIEFELGRSS